MSSSFTIQNTDNWARPYLELQPTEVIGMEPAISAASLILSTMLGPPFSWPWNRAALDYTTNVQDFTFAGLLDFGHIEGGSVTPSAGGGKPYEIMVKNVLSQEGQQGRTAFVSPFMDDGVGNITFRLSPAPDQSYAVNLIYQKKAQPILSMGMTWAPVPDERYYICQWGYLAMMSLIGADARFNEYNAKFITALLAAQGGLNELERNVFLANWTRVMSQLQGLQLGTAERYRARET